MLSLPTSAETPITADGCQTMKSTAARSPADLKYAFQSMPGALTAKSARFHGLFCLKTSAASASGAKACAIRISSDKTCAALGFGVCNARQFQDRGDMRLVLSA